MMTNNVPTTGLIGVVCGDTIDEVLRLAEMSARISHNSDEAARSAQAAAAAVFLNRKGESKDTVHRYILQFQ